MFPLTDYTSLDLSYFLTNSQIASYSKMSRVLQDIIQNRLLEEDSARAHLVIDIFKICNKKETSPTIEKFFLSLIQGNSKEVNAYLTRLLEAVKKGHGEAFFLFTSTKKREYYDAGTLLKIIELFCNLANHKDAAILLPALPCYDEGGKEYIFDILHPSQKTKAATPFTLLPPLLTDLLASSYNYSKLKSEAIRYLSSIPVTNRLSIEVYLIFFKKLDAHVATPFKDYEKCDFLKFIVLTTSHPHYPTIQDYALNDLYEALEEAQNVHNSCGEEILHSFCKAKDFQSGALLEDATRALQLLSALSANTDLLTLLKDFENGTLTLSTFLEDLEKRISDKPFDPNASETDLDKLGERFKQDKNVNFPLSNEVLAKIIKQYKIVRELCQNMRSWNMSTLVKTAGEIRSRMQKASLIEKDLLQLVAIGRLMIRIKFGIYPYNTQILSLLGLLSDQKGCIAQIKTGEGKSTVVTLLALMLALQGKSVDVISSSPSLAKRDRRKYADFFKAFALTTSHICQIRRTPELFKAHILYGAAHDFEFSIMEEKLYFVKLFEQRLKAAHLTRNFDCIIVDEVDNLTIDTVLSGAHLGSPAEVTFDWVYTPIFQFAKEFPQLATLSNKDTISKLKEFMTQFNKGSFSLLVKKLKDEQLERWVKSAYHALYGLKEKRDYIVKSVRQEDGKIVKKILIVDAENTGKILESSRWQNGVHEFVETKHELEVEKESLSPISCSHAVFYNKYACLYGLTGTLGSKVEREEIKLIYGIDSFDVPTHLPSQRIDYAPIILSTDAEWIKRIVESVSAKTKKNRPCLLLCSTIEDSEIFAKALDLAQISYQIMNEIQEENEDSILERAGFPGIVTVTTNNAGRGTDIILTQTSLNNGGLGVIESDYPSSGRVLDQALGRGGRQGQVGTTEIILSAERLSSNDIEKIKKQREEKIATLRKQHIHRAETERFAAHLKDQFFDLLHAFHALIDDEAFLNDKAQILSKRKILDVAKLPKIDLATLHPRENSLAQGIIQVLTSQKEDLVAWKMLLGQISERLKNKMITYWALNFHGPLENMSDELQGLSVDEAKKKIQTLFDTHKLVWEKAFNLSGQGISSFVREITGVNLEDVFKPFTPFNQKVRVV